MEAKETAAAVALAKEEEKVAAAEAAVAEMTAAVMAAMQVAGRGSSGRGGLRRRGPEQSSDEHPPPWGTMETLERAQRRRSL